MRLQPLQDFATLRESIAPAKAEMQKVPERREVRQQNEESMAALQAMLAGVQGAPGKRKNK